jgi:hypothetical protein
MALDERLLRILVCPQDKGGLYYLGDDDGLYNPRLRRRYEVSDGIPGDADRRSRRGRRRRARALMARVAPTACARRPRRLPVDGVCYTDHSMESHRHLRGHLACWPRSRSSSRWSSRRPAHPAAQRVDVARRRAWCAGGEYHPLTTGASSTPAPASP